MLERGLGARRVRQIHRALRHGKVTLLCLLMTVVVLRGIIGAGKFGTPEQDFKEIRDHLYYRKLSESHRVLEDARTTETINSYASFDPKKLVVDEGEEEEEEKLDLNKSYNLGPKISDWDERRAKWLKENTNFPNFVASKKPRVLLATGSSPCENPVGDHYQLKSIKNKTDYCRLHGIEIFYNTAIFDAEMSGFWSKLPLIRKILLSHPEIEFLWWMDSDACSQT